MSAKVAMEIAYEKTMGIRRAVIRRGNARTCDLLNNEHAEKGNDRKIKVKKGRIDHEQEWIHDKNTGGRIKAKSDKASDDVEAPSRCVKR